MFNTSTGRLTSIGKQTQQLNDFRMKKNLTLLRLLSRFLPHRVSACCNNTRTCVSFRNTIRGFRMACKKYNNNNNNGTEEWRGPFSQRGVLKITVARNICKHLNNDITRRCMLYIFMRTYLPRSNGGIYRPNVLLFFPVKLREIKKV